LRVGRRRRRCWLPLGSVHGCARGTDWARRLSVWVACPQGELATSGRASRMAASAQVST
jgi:hypothetical protein